MLDPLHIQIDIDVRPVEVSGRDFLDVALPQSAKRRFQSSMISSREKKKNRYGPSRNTVGLI